MGLASKKTYVCRDGQGIEKVEEACTVLADKQLVRPRMPLCCQPRAGADMALVAVEVVPVATKAGGSVKERHLSPRVEEDVEPPWQ